MTWTNADRNSQWLNAPDNSNSRLSHSLFLTNSSASRKVFHFCCFSKKIIMKKKTLLMKPFPRRPTLPSRDVFFSERVSKTLKEELVERDPMFRWHISVLLLPRGVKTSVQALFPFSPEQWLCWTARLLGPSSPWSSVKTKEYWRLFDVQLPSSRIIQNIVKNKISCPHATDYVTNKENQPGSRILFIYRDNNNHKSLELVPKKLQIKLFRFTKSCELLVHRGLFQPTSHNGTPMLFRFL